MEFSPFDRSDEEAVGEYLDMAFPPEHAEIPYDDPLYARSLDRALTDEIPTPTGSSMETPEEQAKLRRKLFGSTYDREYRPNHRHINRHRK